MELFAKPDKNNLTDQIREEKTTNPIFDWMLYINIPLVYGIGFYFLYVVSNYHLELYELIGLSLSVGTTLSANGINVAHELGHRKEKMHKWMSKALLLPSLYTHFIIEHNLGHHKNVATDKDPASAKKGQMVYTFWISSLIGSYISAWKIESKRMKQSQYSFYSFRNELLVLTLLQAVFLSSIFLYFGWNAFLWFLLTALISALMLETINYVEHYGLRRDLIGQRYERVLPKHSWNSDHELGRILLYELTRHSDHHFLANKKYQLLDHHGTSKQLPLGYPGSMLITLLPPVWYKLMNERI